MRDLGRLFKFVRPYWWQAILLIISTGIQVWCTLQLPTEMARIVNDGIVTGDTGFIIGTGAIMIVYAIVSALGALAASFFSSRIGAGLGRDLRNAVFTKIMTFSISEIDDFSTASLITRTTTDISNVQNVFTMMLSMMLRTPMMAVGAIIQAIRLAPDMTWIIALAVAVLLVLAFVIISSVMPKFELYQKFEDKINMLTRENLTGLKVVRAFNNQKREQEKFDKTNTDLMKTDIFISTVLSLQGPLMQIIFNGTSLLCIWIGISHLEFDASYLGKMMAFMQYATQTIMSFLFLTMFFVMLPRAGVSAGRINAILGKNPKITWKAKKTESSIPHEAAELEFKHVDFQYPGAEEKVLYDISFKAKAGETTAFIGSTGSGKSTLINLILRLYDVTGGEVRICGKDIRDYGENELMDRIGIVPQKGFLFSGSIADNIAFSEQEVVNKKWIEKCAEVAQADGFIKKLPEKYDYKITEGGTNVSGGQRQRLCIARAIYKDPEIYVFDDAFSALDMKTDAKLRHDLKEVTDESVVIIVAQRVSTIKDAEHIVVLDKGKIVGKGTHNQLLKKCKIYREICKSQLSDAEYTKELKGAKNA